MLFLRKKLLRKFVILELALAVLGLICGAIIPGKIFLIIAIFVLGSCLGFWVLVSRPFAIILREFKALLTGKQYNRLYTQKIDEVGVVAHFFNEVTRSLERVSNDIKEHRRISSELNIAQKIQRDLIPQAAPAIPGLDIIAKTKPAAEIGGDSFDFITKNDQTFFYIGDVTGHGVPSGLVMMIVDTLIHTFVDLCLDSHQLITQVNKYLKPRIQSTMFMTIIMLRWIHPTKQLMFTGAGHETIIHYKLSEQSCENLKAGGIALGMVADNEKLTKEQEIRWEMGDFVILYSDGITEARNMEGELFGIERFLKLIERWAPKSKNAEALFQKIAAELTLFLGEHIQEDDMTLIVIRNGETGELTQAVEIPESTQWESNFANKNTQPSKTLVGYEQQEVIESGLNKK